MALEHRPIDAVTESDLQSLVEGPVAEDAVTEYKRDLPADSSRDKREFLCDVAAMANSLGGHIVYGVRAEGGVPTELCGIGGMDADGAVLRLESLLREGLRPRIAGLRIKAVSLARGGYALVVRIPRTWTRPHMMVLRDGTPERFHGRNAAGRFVLDIDQIRALAIGSATLVERLRAFRADRINSIVGGETPIPLVTGPTFVLHLVPFGAFDAGARVDLTPLQRDPPYPGPGAGGYNHRFNFDGFVTFTAVRGNPGEEYLQFFRSGSVELVMVRAITDRAIRWQDCER